MIEFHPPEPAGEIAFSLDCDAYSYSEEIVSLQVLKRVDRIGRALVTLSDGDMPSQRFELSDRSEFSPGAEVVISAGYGYASDVIFRGIVYRHRLRIDRHNRSRLILDCRDLAVGMTLVRRNVNHGTRTDQEILRQLISDAGLGADVEMTNERTTDTVQHNLTDWDFMLERARANGFLVLNNDGHLQIGPRNVGRSQATLTWGENLIELDAEIEPIGQLEKMTAQWWDLTDLTTKSVHAGPASLTDQGDASAADDARDTSRIFGMSNQYLPDDRPADRADALAWVEGLQQAADLGRLKGTATANGTARVELGGTATLVGAGERFSGDAYLTGVEHKLAPGSWKTSIWFGSDQTHKSYAEPRTRVGGLHVGIVEKLSEDPLGLHRIQLFLPHLSDGEEARQVSLWARLAKGYATDGAGVVWLPEIGDEVIVGFVGADARDPVVLGSLYSAAHPMPDDDLAPTDENFIKGLRSRVGMRVVLDEEKRALTITTPAGKKVRLDDENDLIELSDEHDNSLSMNADGVVLVAAQDCAIQVRGDLSITAEGRLEIDGKGSSLTATENVIIKGRQVHINS